MPFQEQSIMSQREEFAVLASGLGADLSLLCRRFGISRPTGYKWLARYREAGRAGLGDASRRPLHSPARSPVAVEAAVLAIRDAHPAWGGRKIRARLQALGQAAPAASTITAILRRHQRLDAAAANQHQAFERFEHDAPNQLWQMDFKGHFALAAGRCHPLTVLDDHSRFSICLDACGDERWQTVQTGLSQAFQRYGLPERMLMDNGPPWGDRAGSPYTLLTVWLLQLGIRISHGRPYHPQTQGKEERFHRTLKAELLSGRCFRDLDQCQRSFQQWRHIYNSQRPHEALGMAVPASRYQPSERTFPERITAPDYASTDCLRKVQQGGFITFKGRSFRVGQAFRGHHVALRPTIQDGLWNVCFGAHRIAQVDLDHPIA